MLLSIISHLNAKRSDFLRTLYLLKATFSLMITMSSYSEERMLSRPLNWVFQPYLRDFKVNFGFLQTRQQYIRQNILNLRLNITSFDVRKEDVITDAQEYSRDNANSQIAIVDVICCTYLFLHQGFQNGSNNKVVMIFNFLLAASLQFLLYNSFLDKLLSVFCLCCGVWFNYLGPFLLD